MRARDSQRQVLLVSLSKTLYGTTLTLSNILGLSKMCHSSTILRCGAEACSRPRSNDPLVSPQETKGIWGWDGWWAETRTTLPLDSTRPQDAPTSIEWVQRSLSLATQSHSVQRIYQKLVLGGGTDSFLPGVCRPLSFEALMLPCLNLDPHQEPLFLLFWGLYFLCLS